MSSVSIIADMSAFNGPVSYFIIYVELYRVLDTYTAM